MALRINFFGRTDLCLDVNHRSCEKNWTHAPSASGSYGRLAGFRQNVGVSQSL